MGNRASWKNSSVAPKAKRGKRDAILDAMLEVVVERGFHDAPMSVIAERSGASAGVIYHHFASKDEIIRALYERIHALKRDSFFEGYAPEMDAKEAFVLVGTNIYRFYRKHQREMRFLEQYEIAGFSCEPEEASFTEDERAFVRRFGPRSEGGVLKDWPREVLAEFGVGVVTRLARQPQELSPALLREMGESLWEALKA